MTYDAKESSAQDGQPKELYEFIHGSTTYRYTSWDVNVEHATKTYVSESLDRSEIEETGEFPRNDLNIDVPIDFPVSRLFRVAPPSDVILVILYEVHNTDVDAQRIVKWRGRILNVDWPEGKSVIHCENIYTTLKRQGLRRKYQRQCPHVLYGSACKVVDTAFKQTVTLTLVDGINLTASALDIPADGYFDGGFIEWESSPGITERRAIRSHVGAIIQVTHTVPGLEGGDSIDVYPGCDHSLATCISKFSNSLNYGGFPYIPEKNPFGGNSVF